MSHSLSLSRSLLTTAALALSLGAAQAQDKPVALKFASWVPAQHALNPALVAWGESLKAASGGTLSATSHLSLKLYHIPS